MRTLSKCLGALLLAAAVALPLGFVSLLGLAWYCTDNVPSVARAATLTPAHIEKARRLLVRNDPREARSGMLRTITLTQDELDLVLAYSAQRAVQGTAKLTLQQDQARLQLSLPLPSNPFGGYLNVEAVLADTGALPRIASLRLGRLQVPQQLNSWMLALGLRWLQQDPAYGDAADVIQRVRITPEMLSVVYTWNDALPEQLKASLVAPDDVERLRAYQARLVALRSDDASGLGLHQVLQPLMDLGTQRAGRNATPEVLALERRSALVVAAFYVNGKGLSAVVPAAAEWPAPITRRTTLAGRVDLAQHFIVSAALAATAGTALADAIGLYKETEDARGGSGFSFADLAADRAGTRFGQLAVGPAPAQQRLQQRLTAGLQDQDLLPPIRDLPEMLQEAEFKRRFGSVDSGSFKRLKHDIEQRIGALALYR
jgi:hypothetical protein